MGNAPCRKRKLAAGTLAELNSWARTYATPGSRFELDIPEARVGAGPTPPPAAHGLGYPGHLVPARKNVAGKVVRMTSAKRIWGGRRCCSSGGNWEGGDCGRSYVGAQTGQGFEFEFEATKQRSPISPLKIIAI